MTTVYEYRYDAQFERAIGQFMRVFAGFQVRDGVDRNGGSGATTETVPVYYATVDRVIADMMSKRRHFSSTNIPLMVVNMEAFELDIEERGPKWHRDEYGTEETPTEVIERLIGPGVILNMSLSILASSREELFQIVEQILLIFNPKITLNVDDSKANADYLTEIELTGVSDETSFPIGTSNPAVSMTMNFRVPIRLKYPHGINDRIINSITMNIKDYDSGDVFLQEIID